MRGVDDEARLRLVAELAPKAAAGALGVLAVFLCAPACLGADLSRGLTGDLARED